MYYLDVFKLGLIRMNWIKHKNVSLAEFWLFYFLKVIPTVFCQLLGCSDDILLKLNFSRYDTYIDCSMFFYLEKTWNSNNSIPKQ